jgi:hypothetical protein
MGDFVAAGDIIAVLVVGAPVRALQEGIIRFPNVSGQIGQPMCYFGVASNWVSRLAR